MKLFKYLLLVLMVAPSMLGALSRSRPTPQQSADILKRKIMKLQDDKEKLFEQMLPIAREINSLESGEGEVVGEEYFDDDFDDPMLDPEKKVQGEGGQKALEDMPGLEPQENI